MIAPRSIEEMAEDGDDNRDGGDVDRDGMASSGNADSMRVDSVRLAGEAGQHEKPNDKMKRDVPVSPRPPIRPTEHPYGAVRRRHRCGRLKFESIKVNQSHKAKMAYLEHMCGMQPPEFPSKRLHRVIGLIWRQWRCRMMKIAPRNVSQTAKVENTYLG